MTYHLLVAAHVVAAVCLGIAIASVCLANGRARRAGDLTTFLRARRHTTLVEQRLLRPAVLALLVSGTWLVAQFYGASSLLAQPWLAGMVLLFVFQSAWAGVVVHAHARRLEQLAGEARLAGALTPALDQARRAPLARLGDVVEPLVYLLIMALGAARPFTWTPVLAGIAAVALGSAALAALWRYVPASAFNRASVDAAGRT